MHGKGTMFFGNGDRYVGEFKNDQYNGEGTYYYSNGSKLEGIWKNGVYLNAKPSYKPEYANKSECDPTISSWCKEQQNKKQLKQKYQKTIILIIVIHILLMLLMIMKKKNWVFGVRQISS